MNHRKFLIQFEGYDTDITVVFTDGYLVCIDAQNAGLSPAHAKHMFRSFPIEIDSFFALMKEKNIKCAEVAFQVSFEDWWVLYGKKVNKARCQPIWNKLSSISQIAIYYNTQEYLKYLDKESWRSKADPESFLKKKMYENDWASLSIKK